MNNTIRNIVDLNPQRVIDELRELHRLTGNKDGAQRLAWTEPWDQARGWLKTKLSSLPVTIETDPAGNIWATLPGDSPRTLVLGSHIDSVPNGGWLDGALGVVTGLEVLRHFSGISRQPFSLRLVAWAEEEGAWFGRSMLTSSAVCGSLDASELDNLVDANGVHIMEVLARYGVHAATMTDASRWMKDIAAYLELHIEQGPVLEEMGLPLAAVVGTMGLARHRVRFIGQTAHAGSTPMRLRRDALVAAARLALEIREIAKRHNGVCTMGSVVTRPGIVTAVAGECDCTLDQRHLDAGDLEAMLAETQAAWLRIAKEERVKVEILPLYKTKPMLYNINVINLCALTIEEFSGKTFQMPSGPLHDAVEMARAGIPTGMMFVQSLNGLSHTREEDTREEHLRLAVRAFDSLTMKTIAWLTGE